VGGEVPDDADVLLVQAEVDTLHGDEEHVAELAGVDEVFDPPHGRAVDERVPDHERQVQPCSQHRELDALLGRRRERFLHEDVLPGVQAATAS